MKSLGGQAIVEGVMIKGTDNISMAVRVNKKIITKKEPFVSATEKHKILAIPLIRGVIHLFEMMIVGIKALTWSANQQGEDEQLTPIEWIVTFGIAIILTIGLFVLLPYYASRFVFSPETIKFGILDGVIRLSVFFLYLAGIGIMKDVKRMFQYHGAEHMTVHCYESGKKLTITNAKKFPKEHPRCGTSLLVFVVAVSIVLFSIVRTPHWYYNVPARILLIPVVAGISYELLKFSARIKCLKWLTYPGIWTQKLTTRKPTDKQIEVAIAAVNKAK
ncbi:MAG: DUF1385 domain-containing protein [Candidatus Woesearchaeota archaeon]|nr:DUF1385 domain-containing protein [Candidatus Woesearchaeota archaeon]